MQVYSIVNIVLYNIILYNQNYTTSIPTEWAAAIHIVSYTRIIYVVFLIMKQKNREILTK